MTSKLKRRRWRRMRDALAAYKTEASDWKSLYLERTAEIASLRSQRLLHSYAGNCTSGNL